MIADDNHSSVFYNIIIGTSLYIIFISSQKISNQPCYGLIERHPSFFNCRSNTLTNQLLFGF